MVYIKTAPNTKDSESLLSLIEGSHILYFGELQWSWKMFFFCSNTEIPKTNTKDHRWKLCYIIYPNSICLEWRKLSIKNALEHYGSENGEIANCFLNQNVTWGTASLNSLDTWCRWQTCGYEPHFTYIIPVQITEVGLDWECMCRCQKIKTVIRNRNVLIDERTLNQTWA
jgi:hypothetical protein